MTATDALFFASCFYKSASQHPQGYLSPTTAALMGGIIGPIGAGFHGLTEHNGLREGGRSMISGWAGGGLGLGIGAGAGALAGALAKDPELAGVGAAMGGGVGGSLGIPLGFGYGARRSAINHNARLPQSGDPSLERILQNIDPHRNKYHGGGPGPKGYLR